MNVRSIVLTSGLCAVALTLLPGCGALKRKTLVQTRDPRFTSATAPGPTLVTAAQNCITPDKNSSRPAGSNRPNDDETSYPTPIAKFESVIRSRASVDFAKTGGSFAQAICTKDDAARRALLKKLAAVSSAGSVLVPRITNNATCWQVKRKVTDPKTGRVLAEVDTDEIKCGPTGHFYDVTLYDAEGNELWYSAEYTRTNAKKTPEQTTQEILSDLPVAKFAPGGAAASE